MRVIHINAVYGLSSTGRTVQQLDTELARYGVNSTTVYVYGSATVNDYCMANRMGNKLHALLGRVTGLAGYYSSISTRKMLRYIDSQKPDVVHLQILHSNYINVPMLLKHLAKMDYPTVITLHDCWFYTGKCSHYTVDGCYRWKDSCGKCPRLKKDIPSFLFDRTSKLLKMKRRLVSAIPSVAVVGVSNWITEQARESYLGNSKLVTRIYNWIDTDAFRPKDASALQKKYRLQNKYVILGVASLWMNCKGLDSFLRLSKELPSDMQLVMIGNIPDGVRTEEILHIPPTSSVEQLAEWYSLADVFISLSPEESFGKVSAEALACGTPIITVNSTASPELVGDNCGEVIDDTSVQTVLEAINRLRQKGKMSMTQSCRSFALEHFTMDSNIREYYEVYSTMAKSNKSNSVS